MTTAQLGRKRSAGEAGVIAESGSRSSKKRRLKAASAFQLFRRDAMRRRKAQGFRVNPASAEHWRACKEEFAKLPARGKEAYEQQALASNAEAREARHVRDQGRLLHQGRCPLDPRHDEIAVGSDGDVAGICFGAAGATVARITLGGESSSADFNPGIAGISRVARATASFPLSPRKLHEFMVPPDGVQKVMSAVQKKFVDDAQSVGHASEAGPFPQSVAYQTCCGALCRHATPRATYLMYLQIKAGLLKIARESGAAANDIPSKDVIFACAAHRGRAKPPDRQSFFIMPIASFQAGPNPPTQTMVELTCLETQSPLPLSYENLCLRLAFRDFVKPVMRVRASLHLQDTGLPTIMSEDQLAARLMSTFSSGPGGRRSVDQVVLTLLARGAPGDCEGNADGRQLCDFKTIGAKQTLSPIAILQGSGQQARKPRRKKGELVDFLDLLDAPAAGIRAERQARLGQPRPGDVRPEPSWADGRLEQLEAALGPQSADGDNGDSENKFDDGGAPDEALEKIMQLLVEGAAESAALHGDGDEEISDAGGDGGEAHVGPVENASRIALLASLHVAEPTPLKFVEAVSGRQPGPPEHHAGKFHLTSGLQSTTQGSFI